MKELFKNKLILILTIVIDVISIILVLLSFGSIIEFELSILFLGISQALSGLLYIMKSNGSKFDRMLGNISIVLGLLIIFIIVFKSVL
ncbi:hypothetical protein [Clostridium sp.]|uniref:hypothetical protein n=1 Tax=Clostridium sp. TaxID=1506 RepID=UPI00399529E1